VVTLTSAAEQRAQAALALPAFSDVNLLGIKEKVSQTLRLIGTTGLFREYTLHDISHVDQMLGLLDWLIPERTQAIMTPADWLLVVLSVYFHDVGMLVTESEFDARDQTDFRLFCDTELFADDSGAEYRSKVLSLGDTADLFMYEEFVRRHHAERIADWINGRASNHRGVTPSTADEVAGALSGLPEEFRRDLSLTCASHHLADLGNTDKYRTSQPYGNSDAETANVQYAAIVLRSADLLHITSDRTPSVMFRLIDPQDPISQREWIKQKAVRRLRSQKGRDRDDKFNDDTPRSIIEVFANFRDADGFFGLSAYLQYAEQELIQARQWVQSAAEDRDLEYDFPWRQIDDREVTATGFLPEKLSFELDQDRILDLLTGHTLYNDTSVVIRELVQNSLDASRLQSAIDGTPASDGQVDIDWQSDKRELTVTDRGTGMSQRVIEKNLLRAGASLYQEEAFKDEHPDFSPISHFGIGVLSNFMIADHVEIITCSPADNAARHLTLRSVHGRYLVRLLDKEVDPQAVGLTPHGTQIKLKVRATVEMPDVLETLKRWIVVPRSHVTATIDGQQPVDIGFANPKQALEQVVADLGHELAHEPEPDYGSVKIVEHKQGGVATAFAVSWSPYFRDWTFLRVGQRETLPLLGTCVEGIRVEETTPGFENYEIIALCNACGMASPKTNVARSGLEATPERSAVLRSIYASYFAHVTAECDALTKTRGVSVTWAAQEADILLQPLLTANTPRGTVGIPGPPEFVDEQVFEGESRNHRFLLVETDGVRAFSSAVDIESADVIWTIDSQFVRAAEDLLREIPTDATLASLAHAFATDAFSPPAGPLLVGRSRSYSLAVGLRGREVRSILVRRDERRVTLGWTAAGTEPRWARFQLQQQMPGVEAPELVVALNPDEIEVDGTNGEIAIGAHGIYYLLAGVPIVDYLLQLRERCKDEYFGTLSLHFAARSVYDFLRSFKRPEDLRELVVTTLEQQVRAGHMREQIEELIQPDELVAAMSRTDLNVFDASVWARRSDGQP
jgi:hypothetical protein